MGLLQKGLETYDAMEYLAGVVESDDKEPLAPIGHICTKAGIEVTIDSYGQFIQARRYDKKIIIPVTENSAGRTSGPATPHPLCEQIGYISGICLEKTEAYLEQLKDWMDFSQRCKAILFPIYQYVSNKSVLDDLLNAGLIIIGNDGTLKNDKDLVCWRVVGLGDEDSAVWTNRTLQKDYVEFYLHRKDSAEGVFSLISGEIGTVATQHLKGVVSISGNAKVVSANIPMNFEGRFLDLEEAMTLSYVDSQKAHNALKWIVSNQGVRIGNRVFVCWNPQGRAFPKPLLPILKSEETRLEPTEYKEDLYNAILGYKSSFQPGEGVVVTSLEAATTGRLAITYYSELQGTDFLERMAYWDGTCCWYDNRWGTKSPDIRDIVRYALGVQRSSDSNAKVEADDRIMSQQVQRLLNCKLDKNPFPMDLMRMIVQKTSRLGCYNLRNRNNLLFITCAAVRKYWIDRFKEEWSMSLEPDKKDRSYQYGRLLAVLEKAESDTYTQGEERDTNAIRMQSIFVQRPAYATKVIIEQLKNAYYPRLSSRKKVYYERIIGEIMQMISASGEDLYDKPLTETYVLGYYLQKNALWAKKDIGIEEEKND